MTRNYPFVSVIIPVFNGEKYLAEAIESALSQEYRPIELIIVDDGSTDRTSEIAQAYPRARYIFQANQTVAVARNTGIAVALGDIVTFLDHDDILLPDSLSKRVEHFIQNPHTQCLIAKHRSFYDQGAKKPEWARENEFDEDHFGFSFFIARKAFLEQVGGFDPKYNMVENTELFFRAKDMGYQIDKYPEVVVLRRIHTSNASRDVKTARMNLLNLARASIERQRVQQVCRFSNER